MCLKISPWTFDFQHYLNYLFFLKDVDICNFADDTTTYISDKNVENVLKSLGKNSMLAIRWFENNYMKLNPDKCFLLVLGCKHKQDDVKLVERNDVKLDVLNSLGLLLIEI